MTATEFADQIKDFAVTKQALKDVDFPDEFAEMLANGYKFSYRGKIRNASNEILNLISNYDMSQVEIGMISLSKEIEETDNFYFFGKLELDRLAISKANNEIVVVDYTNTDEVLAYCASNSSRFLGAMNHAWKTMTMFLLDEDAAEDIDFREEAIAQCTELAGGEYYFDFYDNLLGD